MTSRRNVNLNKELSNDWQGWVRKWEKAWVPCEDKPTPGKRVLKLLKWVQTENRAQPGLPRHPHIVPVKDLSLVPGARVGPLDAVAAAADRQVADPTAAPPLLDPGMQQAAAPAAPPQSATAAAVAPAHEGAAAAQTAAAAAAAVGAPSVPQLQPGMPAAAAAASGLPPAPLHVPATVTGAPAAAAAAAGGAFETTPSSLMLDVVPSVAAMDAAVAAAAAAGSAGGSLAQPSPSGGLSFGLSQPSSMMAGLGAANAMPAASDYTAGTDSEALGRLPHGGPAVSDYTAGTDSMDVDAMMGQSQGAASVQRTGGVTMDDEGDEDLEEEEEEDDDDGMAGEEDDDDVDEDTQEGQEEDGLEDDGLEGDDEDDMPG